MKDSGQMPRIVWKLLFLSKTMKGNTIIHQSDLTQTTTPKSVGNGPLFEHWFLCPAPCWKSLLPEEIKDISDIN